MHQISEAKRLIMDKIEGAGRVEKKRLYSGSDFPPSLIRGAIARLESDQSICMEVDSSGREYYVKRRHGPVKSFLRLFKK